MSERPKDLNNTVIASFAKQSVAILSPKKGGHTMFSIYRIFESSERYIWAQVRILHETCKAMLVTAPFVIASFAKQSAAILSPKKGGHTMFSIYRIFESSERYIWAQVRILHETDKAILVTAPFVIARKAKGLTRQSQKPPSLRAGEATEDEMSEEVPQVPRAANPKTITSKPGSQNHRYTE